MTNTTTPPEMTETELRACLAELPGDLPAHVVDEVRAELEAELAWREMSRRAREAVLDRETACL